MEMVEARGVEPICSNEIKTDKTVIYAVHMQFLQLDDFETWGIRESSLVAVIDSPLSKIEWASSAHIDHQHEQE
jgi:hypothetical protein